MSPIPTGSNIYFLLKTLQCCEKLYRTQFQPPSCLISVPKRHSFFEMLFAQKRYPSFAWIHKAMTLDVNILHEAYMILRDVSTVRHCREVSA